MAEYIDKEAFKKSVEERYCKPCKAEGKNHDWCLCRACWVDDMLDEVGCFRPADVAPVVHGRWIEKSAPAIKIYFECSHCGAQENKHTAIKGYYCWRCGAKMDEKEAVYD